jgi:hypothetical protein
MKNAAEPNQDEWTPVPVPAEVMLAVPPHRKWGRPAVVWEYRDGQGRLLGAVCRWDATEGKHILPLTYCERTDGRREWGFKHFTEPGRSMVWTGIPRGQMRRCWSARAKAADAATVFLPELVAVTSPAGAKAPHKTDWSPLKGRIIIVWPDHDGAGEDYAKAVAELALQAGAASVRIVAVPLDFPPSWDLADRLPAGFTGDDLRALLWNASLSGNRPPNSSGKSRAGDRSNSRRAGASTREDLIELAEDLGEYWCDPDGNPFASVRVNDHVENYPLDSTAFRLLLAGEYGRAHPRLRKDGTARTVGHRRDRAERGDRRADCACPAWAAPPASDTGRRVEWLHFRRPWRAGLARGPNRY